LIAKAEKMENLNIVKTENSKNCVWWKFESIEFYWEIKTGEVIVSGGGYDTKLYFAPAETAKAAGARAAIKQWLSTTFGA
jgi:hypothetical protein